MKCLPHVEVLESVLHGQPRSRVLPSLLGGGSWRGRSWLSSPTSAIQAMEGRIRNWDFLINVIMNQGPELHELLLRAPDDKSYDMWLSLPASEKIEYLAG